MALLTLGVCASGRKENERRLPLHPDHFDRIPPETRRKITFERGYGEPLGVHDAELIELFAGVADRSEILARAEVVLLAEPLPEDLREVREGGIVWGWAHLVQRRELTQAAIDRRLTLIAWESMYTWKRGERDLHLFHRNNQMAGYCAVQHALSLLGIDGGYGRPLRAVVLSLGSVSRGAIRALQSRGVGDITVYTLRRPWALADEVPCCRYGRMFVDEGSGDVLVEEPDGRRRHLIESLAEADVTVNGILQNPERPFMYLAEGEERHLKPGSLIVDVSCDEGMGFPFARPTTFDEATFRAGPATYYAVDHSASYLWRSASWEISRVVVPCLGVVMGGPEAWARDETIRRAIEIRDGNVRNSQILVFQHRAESFPHPPLVASRAG